MRIVPSNDCDEQLLRSTLIRDSWDNTKFKNFDHVQYCGDYRKCHGYTGYLIQWNPYCKSLIFKPDTIDFIKEYENYNNDIKYFEKYSGVLIGERAFKWIQYIGLIEF